MSTYDVNAARELVLFIENDQDLYRRMHTPIIKNLMSKKARGVYDREKAVKLFMYLTDEGARQYNKWHGSGSDTIPSFMNKATRIVAATELRDSFEREAELGNYDKFIPKKYKKNPISRRKARTILHHGEARGRALTKKQRGFMGARASGYPVRKNPLKWRAILEAAPNSFLLGGVKIHKSIWFPSKKNALNWMEQALDTNIKANRQVKNFFVESSIKKNPDIEMTFNTKAKAVRYVTAMRKLGYDIEIVQGQYGTYKTIIHETKKNPTLAVFNPPHKKWYWGGGIGTGKAEATVFSSASTPTRASHGHLYGYATGPFKTKKAASDNAQYMGYRKIYLKNPPEDILSEDVLEIGYIHAEDGKAYKHDFEKSGTKAILNKDGSVTLKNRKHRLHADFS